MGVVGKSGRVRKIFRARFARTLSSTLLCYFLDTPLHLPGGMATDLVDNNLASSSRRSYTSFQKQYVQFCEHPNFNPLLATERQLVLFVAELAQRLSHSTVRSISSPTHADNSSLGDPPSNALRLQLAMKGLK